MRIAFVCGCLEPGRDGVGDYTRRLAEAVGELGHEVALVALHDRLVSEIIESRDIRENDAIPMLRLPAVTSWKERSGLVREFLAKVGAEWVSLQFVPYAFDDRGFVWSLGPRLRKMVGERKVHVMFHELWLGGYRGAPLKERAVGGWQRQCVLRVVRCVHPKVVASSNEAYCRLLEGARIGAGCLPLFGNIPLATGRDFSWFENELRRAGVLVEGRARADLWVFVFFGTLHPVWPPEPLVSHLMAAARASGRTVVFVAMGRLGPGETVWEGMQGEYRDRIRFLNLGEQPTERVSEVLQAADFGIAASPWQLIGKSGSTACMTEHGIPVIVNRDDVQFPGLVGNGRVAPLLIKMDENLSARVSAVRREPPRSLVTEVAKAFVQSLAT